MKFILKVFLLVLLVSCQSARKVVIVKPLVPYKPTVSYDDAEKRSQSILEKMPLSEKISMISGHNSFFIKGFPLYGIPQLYMSDASAGVNIRKELNNGMEKSVSFSAPIALAATWSRELAYDMAKAIGEECKIGGTSILLGPGVNIYRISQNGRNFEYFGEDPYLTARITENYVVGMQSTGTMSTVKHFIANNNEHRRRLTDALIDKRTLHEIYLPAFKAAVDAGVMSVMTSYNMVNGEYTAESKSLVDGILRKELGFKGLVMSDWRSVYNGEKAIKSGLDLEMPGDYADWLKVLGETPFRHLKHEAAPLLAENKVTEADINRMVKNTMRSGIMMGLYDRPIQDTNFTNNYEKHEQVALQVARESIVLLKNANSILPLVPEKANSNFLLTGEFANTLPFGGGSAEVKGYNNVLMYDALKKVYGSALNYIPRPTDAEIKAANVVFLSVGTHDREGNDHFFALPDSVENLVKRGTALNPNTVVIVNSGSGIRMTDWSDKAAAILYAWYPGQTGNIALAEIVSGRVNPSGKLPMTIENDFSDSPGANYKKDTSAFNMPWQDEYSFRFPISHDEYKEGVFVGYRWYESKGLKIQFPFGHGLSYTKFDYSNLKIKPTFNEGEKVKVSFNIKNTGAVAGTEVVQLYIKDNESTVARPLKELKAFTRVGLQPNEENEVQFTLNPVDFSFFDIETNVWKSEAGKFTIFVGSSSVDIRLKKEIELK
ncbi:MAG: glycoside hydrolase family 3 C-terminal domain-containing protein [Bacteroidales bacterium]